MNIFQCAIYIVITLQLPLGLSIDRVQKIPRKKGGKVCVVNGLLSNVEDLDSCEDVYGSVEFEADAKGPIDPTTSTIKRIMGCVYIHETKLFHADFLKDASISCKQEGGSAIYANSYMCLENKERELLKKNGFSHIDVKYRFCPACSPETHNSSVLAKCGTYTSSLFWNSTDSFPMNLKFVDGRLVFRNTILPDGLTFNITVAAVAHSEPAVSFGNTSIPPMEIFDNLKINTFARAAIEIKNITGFRLARDKHAYLTYKFHPKEIDGDLEEDSDCYMREIDYEPSLMMHGLLNCEKMFGLITISTTDHFGPANVKIIQTVHNVTINETDGDLTRVFSQMKALVLLKKAQLIITPRDKICFKADVMQMAKSWLPDDDFHKIHFFNPNCNTFVGPLTVLDLIWEDGSNLKTVIGTLQLADLSLNFRNETTKDGWYNDINRFTELKEIHKTESIPFNVPALDIKMCNDLITLPDFLHTVNITSKRDDDLLIRIRGIGYRMDQENYIKLVNKYGRDRLDIESQFDSDCVLQNPVQDLSVLDRCERIVGDFIMKGNISGSTTAKIKHVSGCIRIEETNLRDLEFFQFDEPYDPSTCETCSQIEKQFSIANNTEMCVIRSIFNVDQELILNNNMNCESNENTISYLGNIVVFGPYNESNYIEYSRIAELDGRIVVTNTDAEYLNLFPSLKKIHYTGSASAILIENNPNLKEFILPSLLEVKVSGEGKAIIMRNNPNLIITKNDTVLYKRAVGTLNITMENEHKYDEKQYDMWKGIGVGIGAACGVAAVVSLVAVIVFIVVYKKKNKSSTVSKEKGKSGNNGGKGDVKRTDAKLMKQTSSVPNTSFDRTATPTSVATPKKSKIRK